MMEQEEELCPVNLWLAGRSYRILVKKSDAERIRHSVKLADEKIIELKQTYSGKDDQDFLAMCLLLYAADSNGEDVISLSDNIKRLIDVLNNALDK